MPGQAANICKSIRPSVACIKHLQSGSEVAMNLDLTLPAFEALASALVVDDDEDLVYLLQFLLQREGFIVHTAANGREANKFIATSKPTDIVITDLMLPYINGFELISQIRDDEDWRDVPIIVLSGKVTERDAVLALELGANDYVTKPYNPKVLAARIRRHLNLRRLARTQHG